MDEKNKSVELDIDEIPESDIQFDCPHCNKHLSIDPRGAGLVIVCPDCEKHVSVPIPEGLDIEDIDATPEELSFRLRTSKATISKLQQQILSLQQQIEELQSFKEKAIAQAAEQDARRRVIKANLLHVAKIQKQIEEALVDINSKIPE
ncbi:MAG: hypothetical protein J6V41_06065 [Kiritimatiellae bacterium]|nr:hypothetical protein [Kiritimatiellia bacterium]